MRAGGTTQRAGQGASPQPRPARATAALPRQVEGSPGAAHLGQVGGLAHAVDPHKHNCVGLALGLQAHSRERAPFT